MQEGFGDMVLLISGFRDILMNEESRDINEW